MHDRGLIGNFIRLVVGSMEPSKLKLHKRIAVDTTLGEHDQQHMSELDSLTKSAVISPSNVVVQV